MKYLSIFAACMLLDAIVPAACQSEEYRKHRFDRWSNGEEDSITIIIDSANVDSFSVDSAENL